MTNLLKFYFISVYRRYLCIKSLGVDVRCHPQKNSSTTVSCLQSVCEPTVQASYSNNKKQFQNCWSFRKLVSVLLLYAFGSTNMSVELAIGIQELDLCIYVYTYPLGLLHFYVEYAKESEELPTKSWDSGSGVKLCTERQMKCCLWAVEANWFFPWFAHQKCCL